MDKASVFRTEESLAEMLDILAGLKDRYERVGVQDKGAVFNYDLTEASSSATCSTSRSASSCRVGPATESRRRTGVRTIRCATTRTGSSTRSRGARRMVRSASATRRSTPGSTYHGTEVLTWSLSTSR